MSPPGALDEVYIKARCTLLDALDGLGIHRGSVVLIGAQAIYEQIGEGDLAVANYTTDCDLALDPGALATTPLLEEALAKAGLQRMSQPGIWTDASGVGVDLLVPEALAGSGTRGVEMPPHSRHAARRARGIRATLIDNEQRVIGSLDPGDTRSHTIRVAGPAALLVSKLHKLSDRELDAYRVSNKDALDSLRLLRAVPTRQLAEQIKRFRSTAETSEEAEEAVTFLERLFATPGAPGSRLAAEAAFPLEDPETISGSCAVLAGDLLEALKDSFQVSGCRSRGLAQGSHLVRKSEG